MCPETVLAIGEHSSEMGKTFALSLGSPQYCRLFKESQLSAIKYVDFLFANKAVSTVRVKVKKVRALSGVALCGLTEAWFFLFGAAESGEKERETG